MKGRHPKPAELRQNRTKKAGRATLAAWDQASGEIPAIPNPDKRNWHPLTESWWQHVWTSPMAGQYLPSDVDGLGRVALLVDAYYFEPKSGILAEIRLQESRFGLSPLDRSRLQWEFARAEESEQKQRRRSVAPKVASGDPRAILTIQ